MRACQSSASGTGDAGDVVRCDPNGVNRADPAGTVSRGFSAYVSSLVNLNFDGLQGHGVFSRASPPNGKAQLCHLLPSHRIQARLSPFHLLPSSAIGRQQQHDNDARNPAAATALLERGIVIIAAAGGGSASSPGMRCRWAVGGRTTKPETPARKEWNIAPWQRYPPRPAS